MEKSDAEDRIMKADRFGCQSRLWSVAPRNKLVSSYIQYIEIGENILLVDKLMSVHKINIYIITRCTLINRLTA